MELQTPQQARQWFRAHGISISQWCRENGVSRHTVNDLLRGKQHGHYGNAHRAAVLLRLKAAADTSTKYHTDATA